MTELTKNQHGRLIDETAEVMHLDDTDRAAAGNSDHAYSEGEEDNLNDLDPEDDELEPKKYDELEHVPWHSS